MHSLGAMLNSSKNNQQAPSRRSGSHPLCIYGQTKASTPNPNMDDNENLPIYDPVKALALVCSRRDLRDFVLSETLAYFSNDGQITALLDPRTFPETMPQLAELAHQATGVARHASMPMLAARLRAITDALDSRQCALAQDLAMTLPDLLDATRSQAAACLHDTGTS